MKQIALATFFFCAGVLMTYAVMQRTRQPSNLAGVSGAKERSQQSGPEVAPPIVQARPFGANGAGTLQSGSETSGTRVSQSPLQGVRDLPQSAAADETTASVTNSPSEAHIESGSRPENTRPGSAVGGASSANTIPLPEGMELSGRVAELHNQLEREQADASWSSAMEVELATYYGEKLALSQQFSLSVIACRQSGCEVQVIGYGPDAFLNWSNLTSDFGQQLWIGEFQSVGVNTNSLGPDVQAIVLLLERRAGGTAVQSVEPASGTS